MRGDGRDPFNFTAALTLHSDCGGQSFCIIRNLTKIGIVKFYVAIAS